MSNFMSTFRSRFLTPNASAILAGLESTIAQLQAAVDKHDDEAVRYAQKANKAQMRATAAANEADRAHRVSEKLRDLLS